MLGIVPLSLHKDSGLPEQFKGSGCPVGNIHCRSAVLWASSAVERQPENSGKYYLRGDSTGQTQKCAVGRTGRALCTDGGE